MGEGSLPPENGMNYEAGGLPSWDSEGGGTLPKTIAPYPLGRFISRRFSISCIGHRFV